MTTIRLPYTDYYFSKAKNPNGNRSRKTALANYTISNFALKSRKVPTAVIGNVMLSSVDSVLDILD